MRVVEAAHPTAADQALLRSLEEQNSALQRHIAWLSTELSRVSADEARVREQTAEVTSRLVPDVAVSMEEVKALRKRLVQATDALVQEKARASAAEASLERTQETLRKREDQVLQLSEQLGRAGLHLKEQAEAVTEWKEQQTKPPLPPPLADLTQEKFAMQQRLIEDLTHNVEQRTLELNGCKAALEVWEARHMVWEQGVDLARSRVTSAGGSRLNLVKTGSESAGVGLGHVESSKSLVEAERAWRERCENSRRFPHANGGSIVGPLG